MSVSDLCMSRTAVQEACQSERLLGPALRALQDAAGGSKLFIMQSFRTAFATLASRSAPDTADYVLLTTPARVIAELGRMLPAAASFLPES